MIKSATAISYIRYLHQLVSYFIYQEMATRQPISSISTTNIWIAALQTLDLTTKILRILRRSEELMFQIRELSVQGISRKTRNKKISPTMTITWKKWISMISSWELSHPWMKHISASQFGSWKPKFPVSKKIWKKPQFFMWKKCCLPGATCSPIILPNIT